MDRGFGVKAIRDAYIVGACRTPVGKAPRGIFRQTRPDDLCAAVLRGLLERAPQIDPSRITDVIVGCAMPEAEQGANVARMALLLAGYPSSVPGYTVNRFCSSGLQTVALAADRIRLGEADLMVAAGTESMSCVPMMGHKPLYNPQFTDLEARRVGIHSMGTTAETVARKWNVSREEQDAFALGSHQKAIRAQEAGLFNEEILPYLVSRRSPGEHGAVTKESLLVSTDEGPRKDTTLEALAKLRPAFAVKGSVTAGNSSQMSDGAGAVLLASERAIQEFGLKPLARFVSYAVAGVPPEIMGIGPREALPRVLAQAGWTQDSLEWIELNEAFASQSLAVIRDLGLDPSRVNPTGGAIALGHPLGATGAIRVATLVHAMGRNRLKRGCVTMCIGTGMGAAGLFEGV